MWPPSWESPELDKGSYGSDKCRFFQGIQIGNLKIIQSYLMKFNLNKDWWWSPLSRAVDTANIATINFFIEQGASVNYGGSHCRIPLHWAIYKKCSLKILETLITKGADVNMVAGGHTPLRVAIQYNYSEAANLLLKRGADVNKQNEDGSTALTVAQLGCTGMLGAVIKSGTLDIVKKLIEGGADVCEPDSNQKTPLLTAVECKNLAAVKLLVERGADVTMQTAFLEAINQNDIEIVQYFLDKGVLIDFVYRNGSTPLTKSIEKKNFDIIKTLVEKGADVNFLNRQEEYPLSKALKTNDLEIVKYLISKGAKIDSKHWNLGKLETSKQAGIKLKSVLKNELDSSLFIEAIQAKNFRIVKYLIEQGVNVNGASATNKIPLAEAAKRQNIGIVRFLVEHGADINLAVEEIEVFAKENEDFEVYLQKLRKQPQTSNSMSHLAAGFNDGGHEAAD